MVRWSRSGIATRLTRVQEMVNSCRYLGVEQMMGVKGGEVVSRVGAEYIQKVRKTRRAGLNMRTTAKLHNSYCVGVLR